MNSLVRLFHDREDGGRQLAKRLQDYHLPPETRVLGLPRGGVVVAYQIAELLNLPLDVFVVRKLGVPTQEELAMGAIASGGVTLLNEDMIARLDLSKADVDRVIKNEEEELRRRERLYRGDQAEIDVQGLPVVVADDGLATGSTMLAAVTALRQKEPRSLMVAVPVASPQACAEIKSLVDDTLCLFTPDPFYAVGLWYEVFPQTSDLEVKDLLQKVRLSPH